MDNETIVRLYVRTQWRVERDLTAPIWLGGEKLKWWLDEAAKIQNETGKKK